MMKYRNKGTGQIIEAEQYIGESATVAPFGIASLGRSINTGDYLIADDTGLCGGPLVMKKKLFEELYEEANHEN